MDRAAFQSFCKRTFNEEDRTESDTIDLFNRFDVSTQDGCLTGEEMQMFDRWSSHLTSPKSALIVVDVQNDFIDGSLSIRLGPAKQDPLQIIPEINRLLDRVHFDFVVYTLDWHPANHISFVANVHLHPVHPNYVKSQYDVFDVVRFASPLNLEQKLWPSHCVADSFGAQLHKDLKVAPDGYKVYKGQDPDVDSYSAFFDNRKLRQTSLDAELRKREITDVFVCGLAYDYCVASTCYDAASLGYKTTLVKSCSRGLSFEGMKEVDEEMRRRNGFVVDEQETVDVLTKGRQIPWRWAKFVADQVLKA